MSGSLEELGLIASEPRRDIPGDGPRTAAAILDATLIRAPERTALVGRSGRYTFADLDRAANRAAFALAELGVRPGDRVAASLPNDVAIAIAFLASQRMGAIWVGINRSLAPPEKAYMLADSGARVLLADPEMLEPMAAHRDDLPDLEHALTVDPAKPDSGWLGRLAAAPAEPPRPAVELDPLAPGAIAYTSGTSGFPKGAVHSQRNMVLIATVRNLDIVGALPADVTVGMLLALTILNLQIRGPLSAWYGGRCLACIDRGDVESVAAAVRKERIGSMDMVPTQVRDMLRHPNVSDEDLESLVQVTVGGADCPDELMAALRKRIPSVVTGYGMTEGPTGVARNDGSFPGSGYRALPHVELEVVDEGDDPLRPGEEGEICVRPARTGPLADVYTPMLGYWGRPEATREALRNGRYHTGDMGVMDAEGSLTISGRRSELILRGGSNVYPAEVERVLHEHPGVAAGAVLGIADERLGERVVAAVQCREGASLREEELRAHVRKSLARYKVPDRIEFVSEMPRNAMQKIVKRRLLPLFEGD